MLKSVAFGLMATVAAAAITPASAHYCPRHYGYAPHAPRYYQYSYADHRWNPISAIMAVPRAALDVPEAALEVPRAALAVPGGILGWGDDE